MIRKRKLGKICAHSEACLQLLNDRDQVFPFVSIDLVKKLNCNKTEPKVDYWHTQFIPATVE